MDIKTNKRSKIAMLLSLTMMGGFGLDNNSYTDLSMINASPPTNSQKKLLQTQDRMSKKRKAILKKQNKHK
jgi:hypothetical protein